MGKISLVSKRDPLGERLKPKQQLAYSNNPELSSNDIEKKHFEANKAHLEFIQRLIYIELQLQRVHCVK